MNLRNFIFWCHLIAGLTIGSVIFIMAVTGALMAFEPQLVDFSEQKSRTVMPIVNEAARLSPQALLEKASAAKSGTPASGIVIYSEPSLAATVNFGRDGGFLYINPYTGEILGSGSKVRDFLHLVEDIHRHLGVKDKGKVVTHACNAAFLFMVLSGFYLWWPRNWNLASLKKILFFESGLAGKARDWNWHNVIGFWCLPLLLITTVTGLVMSYAWANQLLFKITGSEPPPSIQRLGGGVGEKNKPQLSVPENLDVLVARAEAHVPNWKMMNLRLPAPNAPVVFSIQENGRNNYQRSQLTLDTQTAEVVKWEPFSEQSTGRKARVLVRLLHTGEAGGAWNQFLMMTGAIGAVVLVWTGFALSWRRFFSPKAKAISL